MRQLDAVILVANEAKNAGIAGAKASRFFLKSGINEISGQNNKYNGAGCLRFITYLIGNSLDQQKHEKIPTTIPHLPLAGLFVVPERLRLLFPGDRIRAHPERAGAFAKPHLRTFSRPSGFPLGRHKRRAEPF